MGKVIKTFDSPRIVKDRLDASGIADNAVVVGTTATQTLTNKTLTTPTVTITAATVAAAGSAIGNATEITSVSPAVIFATAADGTKGIILPATAAGLRYVVKNDAAANAVLKVYAQASSQINDIAANSAISMAANTCCEFVGYSATRWFTNPLVPS